MIRSLLACFAMLLTSACLVGCSPAQKLVGTWELDIEKAKADLAMQNNPLAAMAAEMMKTMQFQAEFKGDGNCEVRGNMIGSKAGSWRYVKTDGEDLVLMVKVAGETAEREWRTHFVDNDHMQISAPIAGPSVPQQRMPLMRLKKT